MAPKRGAVACNITVPSGVWMAILRYRCDGASLFLSPDSVCRTGDNSPSGRQGSRRALSTLTTVTHMELKVLFLVYKMYI